MLCMVMLVKKDINLWCITKRIRNNSILIFNSVSDDKCTVRLFVTTMNTIAVISAAAMTTKSIC